MASRELTEYSIANSPTANTSVGKETADQTSARARSLLSNLDANGGQVTDSVGGLPSLNTGKSGNGGAVNDALGDFLGSDSGNLGKTEKTIMETFAARAGLAKEGGEASRKLTSENYGEAIAGQLDSNARDYISAQEGRAGFGTQTAAVKFMEDTGAKRVRDLEKQRNSALLESKVLEASRLDNLIFQEQEAITNARQGWLNSLLNISGEDRAVSQEERAVSQENRNIAAFETPEQASRRELEFAQEQANFESVNNLALTAPDAGITQADTFDSAVGKYRNSETYKRDQQAGELAIKKAEADLANTRSLTNARNNPKSSTSSNGPSTSSGLYSSDLDFAIDAAAGNISSKFGQEQFYDRISRARDDSDRISIVADTILAQAPAADQADFKNQALGMQAIEQAINLLDSGVETGVLESGKQYVYNIAGQDYDPNLAQMNQLIISAIQPYRSSVTGAAWGRQEDAEYKNLFGSTKYEPEELRQRLVGIKDILMNKTSGALNFYVNPLGSKQDYFSPEMNRNLNIPTTNTGGNSQSTSMFSDEDFG